ncbi:YfhD family protein [Aquibacillus halophilus]|uniref:YfhD family protein n=1 Tax=Aquibacillus halophilus TaxID=930132 RepID=A0A6A8DFY7_9BACI|nr:YfhD family protein [Aquibacillus halophilus]MRH41777.1 YfhD family protein [Aquibacillus halophilus]
MGRDEHHHSKGKNKNELPQTPDYAKGAVGVDMEMAKHPEVQSGVADESEERNQK